MKFKNFKRIKVRVADAKGRVVIFGAGEERDVPEAYTDLCLSNGLVPMDEVEDAVAREEAEALALAAEAEAAEAADLAAAEAAAAKLDEAAEKAAEKAAAKKSAAAKKAAATRKANANKDS